MYKISLVVALGYLFALTRIYPWVSKCGISLLFSHASNARRLTKISKRDRDVYPNSSQASGVERNVKSTKPTARVPLNNSIKTSPCLSAQDGSVSSNMILATVLIARV
jgi:hypothetical protein